jgi:hypothetical protein
MLSALACFISAKSAIATAEFELLITTKNTPQQRPVGEQ